MAEPRVIALVTARGGSKGLPGKNLRLLAGRPLIAWTIEAALRSRGVARVIVSTEDPGIAEAARTAGAEAPFLRPAELAADDSPHILTSEHAIRWLDEQDHSRPEYVLLLQPTSPLRTSADIDAAIALAHESDADAVVSVTTPKHHPEWLYRMEADGNLARFLPTQVGYRPRQTFAPVCALNGAIYLNRREALLRDRAYVPPGARGYWMPPERSIDIDTAFDFSLAEWLLTQAGNSPPPPTSFPAP